MKRLLIVDDNNRYAEILKEFFAAKGYMTERAVTGEEGLRCVAEKDLGYYSVIVTDITMESQLAGVTMLGRIHKLGYKGTVVVASTGFDVPLVTPFSRLFLRQYGVHYLIPKTTVLKKDILFYPMPLGSQPVREFTEVSA